MSPAELFAKMPVGSCWKMVCACVGRSPFGMRKGETYTQELKVFSIKRIRRQWEPMGRELTFEVQPTGYTSIKTSELMEASIEEMPNFIRVVYDDDKKVTRDYYPVYVETKANGGVETHSQV